MVQPTRTRINAEDYYLLPEYEQNDLIQLIDGVVVLGSANTTRHQQAAGNVLFMLVGVSRQKGGEALPGPIEVYLDEHNIFEPDVLYVAPNSACEIGEKRLTGPPDLVVEVLSPRTARHDRQQKYAAYERHGVREYWIVDPVHALVEVWINTDDGFDRLGAFGGDDTFTSTVLAEEIAASVIFDV